MPHHGQKLGVGKVVVDQKHPGRTRSHRNPHIPLGLGRVQHVDHRNDHWPR